MGKRFAEGTTVSVANSRGEISGILAKHGVERQGWASGPEGDQLTFFLDGHQFRFDIFKPTLDEMKRMWREDGKDWSRVYDQQAKVDGEWRRRWRANVLLLKAKLEFIEGGDSTLEREFLPYMLGPSGQTFEQMLAAGAFKQLTAGGAKP